VNRAYERKLREEQNKVPEKPWEPKKGEKFDITEDEDDKEDKKYFEAETTSFDKDKRILHYKLSYANSQYQ
jgi:hypothetical protein